MNPMRMLVIDRCKRICWVDSDYQKLSEEEAEIKLHSMSDAELLEEYDTLQRFYQSMLESE